MEKDSSTQISAPKAELLQASTSNNISQQKVSQQKGLKLPCTVLVCGPTGSGKTHLTSDLLARLCNGGPPQCGPRFPNKGNGNLINRIIYIGQFDGKESASYDENHNANVQKLLGLKAGSEALTLERFQAIATEEQALQAAVSALLSGKSGNDGDKGAAVKALFNHLEEILTEGDLVVIDDVSSKD